jgi:hypothetical protein
VMMPWCATICVCVCVCVSRHQPLQKVFSPLQEESSNRAYADILARLLCMVLRSLENDNMHYTALTARQRALAVELKEALDAAAATTTTTADSSDSPPSPATQAILQGPFRALCVALFCRMNYDDGRSERGMEECPVYRFLVFACLRGSARGGGFETALSVGPLCARLIFSIRLVVYHEIFQQMLKDDQQRQQQQQQQPATAMAVDDDARCPQETRIKQRERLLRFVHADECTPFAAVYDVLRIANGTTGNGGLSGMSDILFLTTPPPARCAYGPVDLIRHATDHLDAAYGLHEPFH